jgi:hypothetical protein
VARSERHRRCWCRRGSVPYRGSPALLFLFCPMAGRSHQRITVGPAVKILPSTMMSGRQDDERRTVRLALRGSWAHRPEHWPQVLGTECRNIRSADLAPQPTEASAPASRYSRFNDLRRLTNTAVAHAPCSGRHWSFYKLQDKQTCANRCH